MAEKSEPQREEQDLELKRLKRIEKMIVVFTVLLAIAAFLFKKPSFKTFDVLAGGVVAFVYFYLLTKTMYGAFHNATVDNGETNFSPRMAIKISILSIVSVVITLGLLIPDICQPIGYLIGFSSMFISILLDGVYIGMFVTLKPKQ
ncbi:MAG: hypothetical protein U9P07_12055 [Pseudomonadota bacterium]|nr:hypothetical protein [Pseudomonadota bacterium]MEA3240742.1 hypothetical protein [Pseudomonadota bacterium]